MTFPKQSLDGTTSDWSELLAVREIKGASRYRRPTVEEVLRQQEKVAWEHQLTIWDPTGTIGEDDRWLELRLATV